MNLNGLPQELEQFVQQELASGRYASEDELVAEALRLLQAQRHEVNGTSARHDGESQTHLSSVLDIFEEAWEAIPEEAFDALPPDGAEQVDHYIYGTPKRSV